jgi:capsular exopolysaccharide synthesis family protein
MRKQTKLKSLQVTSSVVNEGKTLVAAKLAVTLANYSGAKTLLIEGDLHRPSLASLFGLRDLRGISHWWSEEDQEAAHFLYRFNGMPLWFLAAGKAHDQPSEILRSARLAAAFEQLLPSFDWVVVDSTPMLPIIDANLWSRLVDGTLLVVREGVTPVKALKKGLQSLDHPKLIGVVVNDASQFDQNGYEANRLRST